jgi:hypothetical protein
MGKSAEVVDGKGVANFHGVQRVRKRMKRNELDEQAGSRGRIEEGSFDSLRSLRMTILIG